MQLNFNEDPQSENETEEKHYHNRQITAILLSNFIIVFYAVGYFVSLLFISYTARRITLLIALPCAFLCLIALSITMQ